MICEHALNKHAGFSSSLHRPEHGNLIQIRGTTEQRRSAIEVQLAIKTLIRERDYPCVPALLSLESDQYLVGLYGGFGQGRAAADLYGDLERFQILQKESVAPYMSFWAIFKDSRPMPEDLYEQAMWRELSDLSSVEGDSAPWDPNFSSDPASRKFCLSLGGKAFFVVGMHPFSSRKARRFPWNAIVFNLYDQFEELARQNRYEQTVKLNRSRELKYQGDLNPMVEKYGEKWEAIQFSGKDNPSDWKCPFHRKAGGKK